MCVCVCVWKAHGGDGRLAGALSSRCSSLSSINTSSGIDVESPSDTASLSCAQLLLRRYLNGAVYVTVHGNPCQSYSALPLPYAITHCILPDPPQVNAPWLNLRQSGRPVLDLRTPEGWTAELTWWLVIYRAGLPVRRLSPIQVLITG